jgi:transcriptional regulator with XRE-family HTH domain
MDINNIGKRVLRIRQDTKFSQKKFAEFANVSYSYLAAIERGKVTPSFKFIVSVLNATKANADWLFTGKGSMYPQIKKEKQEIKEINENRVAYGADNSPGFDDVLNILKSHWDKLSDVQKKVLVGMVKEMIEKNEMKEFVLKFANQSGELLQVPS